MKLEAYLFTYWQDSNLILARANIKTNINYSLITAEFEAKNLGLESIPFRYGSKYIGTAQVSYSVDFVKENLVKIHQEVRQKLFEAKKLDLSSGPDKYCFAHVENITSLENAVKSACRHLIYTYGVHSKNNPN